MQMHYLIIQNEVIGVRGRSMDYYCWITSHATELDVQVQPSSLSYLARENENKQLLCMHTFILQQYNS